MRETDLRLVRKQILQHTVGNRCPKRGLQEIDGDLLEADFWPECFRVDPLRSSRRMAFQNFTTTVVGVFRRSWGDVRKCSAERAERHDGVGRARLWGILEVVVHDQEA